jgi:hypothetical protein
MNTLEEIIPILMLYTASYGTKYRSGKGVSHTYIDMMILGREKGEEDSESDSKSVS